MIYQGRDELTIIESEESFFTFEELRKLLLEKPVNVIYVEEEGKLKGIISTGDIARAREKGDTRVGTNKNFTVLHWGEHVKARSIFTGRSSINALPVVDNDGALLGNYSRWNDTVWLKSNVTFMINLFINDRYYEKENLVFIKPGKAYKEKQEVFKEFERNGICGIEWEELSSLEDESATVLFYDEDEIRAALTIYWSLVGTKLTGKRFITYKQYYGELQQRFFYDRVNDILKEMQEKGVHVLTFGYEQGVYLDTLRSEIKKKYEMYGFEDTSFLHDEFRGDFFDGLVAEKEEKISLPFIFRYKTDKGVFKVRDTNEKWFHVKDGVRATAKSPINPERMLYMYGPCNVFCQYNKDEHTIASFLQKTLNANDKKVEVVNAGGQVKSEWYLQALAMTRLCENDIVVFFKRDMPIHDVFNIDLTKLCEEKKVPSRFFVNNEFHCNHRVNEVFSDAIYEKVKDFLKVPRKDKRHEYHPRNLLLEDYTARYFTNYPKQDGESVGAIVMNCNPFTKGHRYLIEEAKSKVDKLIIFVVEENESYFSFEERFIMVCEGVKDLENVIVVPSGTLILSRFVFPEYFVKTMDEDIIENTENDVRYFGEVIAKHLNIKCRFVGEEPEDMVTNQYNNAMKKILPLYGVEVIEIPRKQNEDGVISASAVRKCLEEGKIDELDRLVPESTKRVLGLLRME